jgi:hypothetical protein
MSDQDDNIPEEKELNGMVRKTRRVRKKRRQKRTVSEGKEAADSLFAKAKDLLIGMEENDDDYGPVDVAEQVRRLKNKKTEDDRPLDDVWGTKRRSSAWLWIVLVGLIGSVVAIMVGVTLWVTDDPPPLVGGDDFDSSMGKLDEEDLSDGPLGWFNENSVEVLDEAKQIIHRINDAESAENLAEIVRESPYRKLNPIQLEKWGSPLLTNPSSKFQWVPKVSNTSEGSGSDPLGYLQLTGTREDGNPYEIYFVQENDKVLLDWEASLGWSELPIPEFIEKKPRKMTLIRCRVTKEPSFDQMFGSVAYSGYLLSGEFSDQFFLAYVPLDSERGKIMDRDFKLMLNYGSGVTDEPPLADVKATVRVRYGDADGNENIFEIVEFLHDGWVTP